MSRAFAASSSLGRKIYREGCVKKVRVSFRFTRTGEDLKTSCLWAGAAAGTSRHPFPASTPPDWHFIRSILWQLFRGQREDHADSVPDHSVPLAKGGSDDDANVCCLCAPCHQARTAEQFGYSPAGRGRCQWLASCVTRRGGSFLVAFGRVCMAVTKPATGAPA